MNSTQLLHLMTGPSGLKGAAGPLQKLPCHLLPALFKRSLLPFKPQVTKTSQKVLLNQLHLMSKSSCYPVNLKRCHFSITEPCTHRVTAWPDRFMVPRHTSLRCTAAQAATHQVLWQSCSSSQTATFLHKRWCTGIHSTACRHSSPMLQQVLLPQLGIGMQDSRLVRGHQLFLQVCQLHSQQPLLAASEQLYTCLAGLTLLRKHTFVVISWHMRFDALKHHVFQMNLTHVIL